MITNQPAGLPTSDRLGSESSLPHRWFAADGIDFVDLGDIKCFILVNDNLYRITVPPERKNHPIDAFYRQVSHSGYPASPVTQSTAQNTQCCRHGFYVVLEHMIRHGLAVDFIDVGAFIGDVGLRYANFFRTIGHNGKVYCLDPSLAGELIPFNIQVNGLDGHVQWIPRAVADFGGFLTFCQRPGSADSSSAAFAASSNTIVKCIRLSDFLTERNVQSALIKLDTENLEARILSDLGPYMKAHPHAIAIEFHAGDMAMRQTLSDMLKSHLLVDVGYVPHPFAFQPIHPSVFDSFVGHVAQRPWGYTDVLAISADVPNLQSLCDRICQLQPEPIGYSLYLD